MVSGKSVLQAEKLRLARNLTSEKMDGAAPSGPASQALIALYCTTASQTAVGIRIMLVKKQISGRTLKTCILPGDAGEPGATPWEPHTLLLTLHQVPAS